MKKLVSKHELPVAGTWVSLDPVTPLPIRAQEKASTSKVAKTFTHLYEGGEMISEDALYSDDTRHLNGIEEEDYVEESSRVEGMSLLRWITLLGWTATMAIFSLFGIYLGNIPKEYREKIAKKMLADETGEYRISVTTRRMKVYELREPITRKRGDSKLLKLLKSGKGLVSSDYIDTLQHRLGLCRAQWKVDKALKCQVSCSQLEARGNRIKAILANVSPDAMKRGLEVLETVNQELPEDLPSAMDEEGNLLEVHGLDYLLDFNPHLDEDQLAMLNEGIDYASEADGNVTKRELSPEWATYQKPQFVLSHTWYELDPKCPVARELGLVCFGTKVGPVTDEGDTWSVYPTKVRTLGKFTDHAPGEVRGAVDEILVGLNRAEKTDNPRLKKAMLNGLPSRKGEFFHLINKVCITKRQQQASWMLVKEIVQKVEEVKAANQ